MGGTRAALFAAIGLSLGFGQQAFSAQPSNSDYVTAPQSAGASDLPDSDSGDIQFPSQVAEARDVLASHYAPDGQPPEVLPRVSPDADVATDLANQLNSQNGAMADGTDSPMCCGPACCCCCPSWTFSAGAIFLNQSSPGHSPVLIATVRDQRVIPRPPLLGANQFNPGLRFGYELDAIRHNVGGSCWDLEARYFGINRWNSTVPTTTVPPLTTVAIPFVPTAIPIAGPGYQIGGQFQSLLQNVELNARRSVNPWLQLIVGVRYIAYDDSTSVLSTSPTGVNRFSTIAARNNLIGSQIGANAFLWQGGRAGLQAFGKGGIYSNAASNSVSVNNGAFNSAANGGHTSFVGEVGLTGTYRITKNWGLRSTYEMLWLDGVARSPDQIASSNPFGGTGSVTSNGSLFYYGGFIGLEYYR